MITAILSATKRGLISLVAFALVLVPMGGVAFAADGSDCTPPSSSQPGVHWPTGSDSGTFTYNCDGPNAGNWTNPYYVFDTATTQRTPLYAPDYQFNCDTVQWTMIRWNYSPAQGGSFYSSRVKADTTPNQAINCPVGTAANPTPTSSTDNGTGQSVTNTGPGSDNSTNNNTTLNTTTTNNNNLTMTNGINSQSTTGNASILGNTQGGSAGTGNALSIANIANMLQTTSNVFGPNTSVFSADINGDVNGDFVFDPSASLSDTGPNSTNSANNNLQVNSNDTNNTNAQITNNVNVGATSGDAKVADNTSGGNATSGNASAIVNLMNLINSTVTAGHSFVGSININGNLNGDILLPQNYVDQLLASSGPNSDNSTNNNVSNTSNTTNNTNENIGNNINSTANTGDASVSGNTSAGSANTGKANTNVTLLNLTGSNVVGSNDLLVFVNVLGHWVGMIVNAPTGSTAASLGGGITNTGPSSDNSTNNNLSTNSNTTNNTNLGITNNVNVSAQSGDASVRNNTSGGNATTGNANTGVNVLNVTDSTINLSNWFGILFINVFGNWTGSFGVNTSAGDPIASTNSSAANTSNGSTKKTGFQFVPHSTVPGSTNQDAIAAAAAASSKKTDGVVLAAKTTAADSNAKLPTVAGLSSTQKTANHFVLPIIGFCLALAILVIGERRSRATANKA